jgi:hypothetical protein
MREIVHIQVGQCGNQIGAKVKIFTVLCFAMFLHETIASMTAVNR